MISGKERLCICCTTCTVSQLLVLLVTSKNVLGSNHCQITRSFCLKFAGYPHEGVSVTIEPRVVQAEWLWGPHKDARWVLFSLQLFHATVSEYNSRLKLFCLTMIPFLDVKYISWLKGLCWCAKASTFPSSQSYFVSNFLFTPLLVLFPVYFNGFPLVLSMLYLNHMFLLPACD